MGIRIAEMDLVAHLLEGVVDRNVDLLHSMMRDALTTLSGLIEAVVPKKRLTRLRVNLTRLKESVRKLTPIMKRYNLDPPRITTGRAFGAFRRRFGGFRRRLGAIRRRLGVRPFGDIRRRVSRSICKQRITAGTGERTDMVLTTRR